MKLKDLTGQRFGKLVVIKYVGDGKWLCRCDCGTEKIIHGKHLKSGNTVSCGCYRKERMSKMATEQTGNKNPHYNHNLTEEERKESRKNCEHDRWSKEVKKQANWTCAICGKRGGKMEAHHLDDWHSHHDKRFDVNNGVCLCKKCHKEFHVNFMGNYNKETTKEDFEEFKKSKTYCQRLDG